ncbi:hypothetical protein [Streptacidiphilus jiangxiensis]|uniref:Uncharacterized protein n=1 Tax=Streptacidiphilus jiangxiensis TaxID=235985 RepID=A0A1H8AZ00_STRJI|nr:hypothetical protein [Streptacidiphilus jiangxiensis]SEM75008.1 hypothetical protein SAMN05414137_1525 [Streptacidiphilus jiangxiensis]
MSTAAVEVPVARSYTRARRHPWVLGKLGEIRLWLGPYSRPQLVVAGVGLLVLGKTIPLWWPVFGPLPIVGLGFAVWAARCARIGGRVPEAAVWGWILLAAQPRSGRIAGRPAKDRASTALHGGFFLTETVTGHSDAVPAGPVAERRSAAAPGPRAVRRPSFRRAAPARPAQRRPQALRPDRTTGPTAAPVTGGRTAPADAAPESRPRSALDLLLEQSGARTLSKKA